MQVQITTLVDNTANFGFLAEWGLSMLVEVNGLTILMDTGMSTAAVSNADHLGINLNIVDKIVLSHGHIDHTGGLREVLRRTGKVEVIAHPDIWASKYQTRYQMYIGIPFRREELESLGASFHLSRQPVRITDEIMTTGEIPMINNYEELEPQDAVKENNVMHQDPLDDDLALVVKLNHKLLVILGCAHHGIINTLHHAQKLTNEKQIYAVIGGTHLARSSEKRIDSTVQELKALGVERIGASHCTGFYVSARLAREFGKGFFLNNAGTRLTLP